MYVLRVNFKTGLSADYLFDDLGRANGAMGAADKCRTDKAQAILYDDAGRQIAFSGADVMLLTLIDVVTETTCTARLMAEINATAETLKRKYEQEAFEQQMEQDHPQVGDSSHGETPPTPGYPDGGYLPALAAAPPERLRGGPRGRGNYPNGEPLAGTNPPRFS